MSNIPHKVSWSHGQLEKSVLITVPMHGQGKLSKEGYRTRDGHLIEWFSKLLSKDGTVAVVSRPEPYPMYVKSAKSRLSIIENTVDISTATLRMPNIRDRRRWWSTSVQAYPQAMFYGEQPFVAWNPFIATHSLFIKGDRPMHFDLLDDWTNHFAFAKMKREVNQAYAAMFDAATSITANSEATLGLAHKFGRKDAHLMTNGCDPEKFSQVSAAEGPLTVGYVGKIGRRLDLQLILEAAEQLPKVRFVFAGPFLDREYYRPMKRAKNIELLGDVHYRAVPKLLTRFDIGWVPHLLGSGEVGGDVIKTYEYRAAGLPVLTTPVLGAGERGLTEVHVEDSSRHVDVIKAWATQGPRIARIPETIPNKHTWKTKAETILSSLV